MPLFPEWHNKRSMLYIDNLAEFVKTYYYDPEMSKMDFDYQLVSFEESLKRVAESLKK